MTNNNTTELKNGWVMDEYGDQLHYVNNSLHNDGGPAIIDSDGYQSYWLFNIRVTKSHLDILGMICYPKQGFTKEQVETFRRLVVKK